MKLIGMALKGYFLSETFATKGAFTYITWLIKIQIGNMGERNRLVEVMKSSQVEDHL